MNMLATPLFSLPFSFADFGKLTDTLPVTDHTWVFFIVLAIILLAPMLFTKLRIPHLIGMILAGMAVGEHGLNILQRDGSFELFGQVGIYYIMFLAGLEMDLANLKQNRRNGLIFGAATALIPFVFGYVAGNTFLHYSVEGSLLLACILASHTLVSYPIVQRYGLSHNQAVTVSVAATVVALLCALLVLAALAGTIQGTADALFWLLFLLKFLLFLGVIFFIFPRLIRAFFRTYTDDVLQFIFTLGMVFLAAAMADVCGIEGILGAFLAGIVFNRFVPRSTPLMNRLEFVGNAIFIPYFLIGVGMLVNIKPLFTSADAVEVVTVMVVAGTLSKYLAATFCRRFFSMTHAGGQMMFGLTEAHAAGALAIVMVGTSIEMSPGVPLMSPAVLDGVVVMILISCIISSIATDQAAKTLKIEGEEAQMEARLPMNDDEKIFIPINDEESIPRLVMTGIMMRNPQLNRGLICLNVVNDEDTTGILRQQSKNCLDIAEQICAAADVKCQTQSRLAVNFVNGVVHAFRENDASEIIIGLHRKRKAGDSLLGPFAKGLIDGLNRQIIIVKYLIPVNTFRRMIVAVPEHAQYESGFYRWVERLARFAIEIGCRIEFHATEETACLIRNYLSIYHPLVRDEYTPFDDDVSLKELAEHTAPDHLFVLVTARHGTVSYERRMAKLEQQMGKNFADKSFMIIYPDHSGEATDVTTFSAPHGQSPYAPSRLTQWLSKWISKIG